MNIVTHRFRGFSDRENSYRGFKTALEEGVVAFEFDVRLTSDGIPVVNHDRSINLLNGDRFDILTNNYRDLINSTGGDEHLRVIMSLAEALEIFAGLREDESKIFIDIKDYGEEEVIVSMINEHSLRDSVVIVSWLPEVLFRIHVLDPGLPLCFSHNYIRSTLQFNLMKEFLTNKTVKHVVGSMTGAIKPAYAAGLKNIDFFFDEYNSFEAVPARNVSINRDFEHTLNGPVTGRLYEIIESSNGFLCIQHRMLDNEYACHYSKAPRVIPYSINDKRSLLRLPPNLDCPYILSDNPQMVSRF